MKKICTLTIIVTVLTLQSVLANKDTNPTVKEQLENLNQEIERENYEMKKIHIALR